MSTGQRGTGLRAGTILLLLALWLHPQRGSAADLRLVALGGDDAPGTWRATFTQLFSSGIDAQGRVSFGAYTEGFYLQGGPRGIWTESTPGTLTSLVREGLQATGLGGGVVYGPVQSHHVGAGTLAVQASISGPGVDSSNDLAIWTNASGSLAPVVVEGDAAPGLPGVQLSSLDFLGFRVGASRDLIFSSDISGAGFPTPVWSWWSTMGGLHLVAHDGQQAPGLPDGVRFNPLCCSTPGLRLDPDGYGWLSTRAGDGVSEWWGVWAESATGPRLLLLEGDQLPGSPGVTLTGGVSVWSVAGSGEASSTVFLSGAGVDSGNDRALALISDDASLEVYLRDGDPAPAPFVSATIRGLGKLLINARGDRLFGLVAEGPGLDRSNDIGYWLDVGGALNLVFRTGDPAPGTNGREFDEVFDVELNAAGHAALVLGLADGDFDEDTRGLWLYANPSLELVLRKDDVLQVAPGDFRTVEDVDLGGMNDRGQLAIEVDFYDGSQAIYATPEPSGAALALTVLGALGAVARRRRART